MAVIWYTDAMDDTSSHIPPDPGQAGQAETAQPVYSLDINQVSALFDAADLPRSRRTLLRFCQHDKLDCTKPETVYGEQYFVSEHSVERLIAEILERERFTRPPQIDTHPGAPGQAPAGLAGNDHKNTPPGTDGQAPPDPGQTGQDPANERLLKQAERENDLLRTQIDVKDQQIERMNSQIDDFIERGREDKILTQNFQRKLGMLPAPGEWETRRAPFESANQDDLPLSTEPVDSPDISYGDMV